LTSADSNENSASNNLLAAILHNGDKKGDNRVRAIAERLQSQGYRVGGVVQSNITQPDQCRCDMVLRELISGQEVAISQNLGSHSQGCRLDPAALGHVAGLVEASFDHNPDILILNKFGKTESEGGGLRNAIALAVSADIPVLVGLNRASIDAWNEFCGGDGQLLESDNQDIENWLDTVLAR